MDPRVQPLEKPKAREDSAEGRVLTDRFWDWRAADDGLIAHSDDD